MSFFGSGAIANGGNGSNELMDLHLKWSLYNFMKQQPSVPKDAIEQAKAQCKLIPTGHVYMLLGETEDLIVKTTADGFALPMGENM
jgi:hypothetical protein